MSEQQCTPQDAQASTPACLEGGALQRHHEQEKALQRFRELSRAYYLLSEANRPERLERVGELMDKWASRLRS